ncbi:uncharacterized protein B0H64DRAFT_323877 [Chaetomium fimeti]|uniref:SH3 domain-containing protein n=1 Tax=Chaetomium fimeti TaxID=1854472 RepID=A0AAE0HFX2_9PEZI|nr:hypothetical protein B0H64DRAFT_323877 [Chaetomium fimeti]
MTRPEIIRADTIDLQDHETPSAQRHHGPPPNGSLAPHQAETLREIAAETAEENLRSPGVAWNPDPDDVQIHTLALDPAAGGQRNVSLDTMRAGAQKDALAVAQNGGHEVDDGDLDGDAEVDMDDDMMDKISSSPSIEDGGLIFALPALSLSETESLPASRRQSCAPADSPNVSDQRSSSPYLESPDHLPLGEDGRELRQRAVVQSPFVSRTCRHHHHDSGFVPSATTEDHVPSELCPLPDDSDFDDSLLWADEEDECDFELEDSNNGDGLTTIRESRGEGVNNENNAAQEDNATHGLTVPYESDEEDDDDDGDFSGLSDPRFIDSGWGGECLQETEDIDFDFVYALHTFVATVEGQANATKGDTMVLLDDSNSYWWLLSASMLGDQQDKARNPIRSAMKRRKKNVQFAAPTYVDYSDIDYSTEEEDADGELAQQQQGQQSQKAQQSTGDGEMHDETAKVEPLKPRSQTKQAKADSKRQEADDDTDANTTVSRAVEEAADVKTDGPKKSSDGTVRDSFFKDDTVETKKITLTPNLLRDDNAPRASTESREVKQRPSLDKLDKDSIFSKDDKKKKKEKEKDKKPGGLRGFFSRKDKKSKGEDDDDSFGKRSMDADAPEKDIEEEESQGSPEKAGPQRNPSKLQKQPRGEPSPTRRSNSVRENGVDVKSFLSEGRVNNVANVPPASMRLVESSPKASPQGSPRDQRPERDASPVKSSLSKAARPEPRPVKSAIAKPRAEFDDLDSDEDVAPEPTRQAPVPEETTRQEPRDAQDNAAEASQPAPAIVQPTPIAAPAVQIPARTAADGLSDSPVQDRVSPVSSPSPELIEHDDAADMAGSHKMATTPSTTRSESWDDAGLRAFFDSGSDIRDLLLVVYDKNDVDDVGPDHPAAGSLFREQNAKLAEITTRLDDMLGDWLARKQRLRGSV